MKYLLFLIILLHPLAKASGQRQLEPLEYVDSLYPWDIEYKSALRAQLFHGLSDRPIARLIIGERVLSVEWDSIYNNYWMKVNSFLGGYWNSYQYKRADSSLRALYRQHSQEPGLSELMTNPSELKLHVVARQIDSELAVSVHTVFLKAINHAEKPAKSSTSGIADGTDYEFYVYDPRTSGMKGAMICSPKPNTEMNELVNFGWSLMRFCDSPYKKIKKKIMTKASLLMVAEELQSTIDQ
jgi:hypothetical protein